MCDEDETDGCECAGDEEDETVDEFYGDLEGMYKDGDERQGLCEPDDKRHER